MSTAAPSRKQARDAAREERRRREEEALLKAARKRRLVWVGAVLGVAVAIGVVLIAALSGGGSDKTPVKGKSAAAASVVAAEYAGIPQKGNVLGNPNAKATMVVCADMQCPFCAEFENKVMPSLVQRYVRSGKLKLQFQPLKFIGNDSVKGAHFVTAAGLQNKEFDLASVWYRNQGTENTGYATDAYLHKLARGVRGLDATKLFADMKSERVAGIVARASAAGDTARVDSTPTFLVGHSGKTLKPLQVPALTPNAFYGTLDSLTS